MQNNGFSSFPSYIRGRAFIICHPVFSGVHMYACIFTLWVEMRPEVPTTIFFAQKTSETKIKIYITFWILHMLSWKSENKKPEPE